MRTAVPCRTPPDAIEPPSAAAPDWCLLEIESVDVLLREDERLSEQHLVAVYLDPSKAPGLEGGTPRRQRAGRHRVSRKHGEIAEVARVPQDDALDHARLHV